MAPARLERASIPACTDAYETIEDVLGELDLPDALRRIAKRAAAALGADSALFVIQMALGEPLQYLHHGLDELEAARLGAQLLEVPDVPEGEVTVGEDRLVIDVASSRQVFGRLGVFVPDGAVVGPAEARALSFYSATAAATMELATARDEARRHEATADAVLGLARSLADMATARARWHASWRPRYRPSWGPTRPPSCCGTPSTSG